jgi:hypothetical protein
MELMSWFDDAAAKMDEEAGLGRAIVEAEDWKPEAGDTLIGRVQQISAVITKYGLALKVWVQDTDGDMWQVFGSASMFKEEFVNAAPMVGFGIAIRYDGKPEGQYARALWYISTEPHDEAEARKEIFSIIEQAEKLAAAKPKQEERDDPPPVFNGSSDDELTAPF